MKHKSLEIECQLNALFLKLKWQIYLNYIWTEGIHPFGIVNRKEDYNVLQTAGRELFQEINELINAGKIDVNGKEIKLEFFLGGKVC